MKPIEIALDEYGVQGIVGGTHNPRVLQYFAEMGHAWVKDDETAWCAAFANWVLKKANIAGTGKLNARSFLDKGVGVANPKVGDIVVLWRISKNSPYGHVGFYVNQDVDNIYILGGNQDNSVCIKKYPKYMLLGYRHY